MENKDVVLVKNIDDEIITEVTSKVINVYEKVKEKLNLQD